MNNDKPISKLTQAELRGLINEAKNTSFRAKYIIRARLKHMNIKEFRNTDFHTIQKYELISGIKQMVRQGQMWPIPAARIPSSLKPLVKGQKIIGRHLLLIIDRYSITNDNLEEHLGHHDYYDNDIPPWCRCDFEVYSMDTPWGLSVCNYTWRFGPKNNYVSAFTIRDTGEVLGMEITFHENIYTN